MNQGFTSTFLYILRIALSIICVWFAIQAGFPLGILYAIAAVLCLPVLQHVFDRHLKQKMILPLLTACIVLCAAFLQYMPLNGYKGPLFEQKQIPVLEYGTGTADPLKYVVLYSDTKAECDGMVDLSQTGVQKIGCRFERGWRKEDAELIYEVNDTKAPEITFFEDTVVLYEHSDYNALSNILSVNDPVDGALEYLADKETPTPGTYTVHASGDITVPGIYTITVTAADRNGVTAHNTCTYEIREDAPIPSEKQKEEAFEGLDPNMGTEELIRYIKLLYLLQGEEVPAEVSALLDKLAAGDIDSIDFLELLIRLTQ